jgi:cytochrome P450
VWDGRVHLLKQPIKSASNQGLIGVRDLRRHAQLRKPWNNAFQSAALIDYEDMLRDRAAQFMTHLQKLCEEEVCVDLANLISFFSFVFRLLYYYHTHYIVTVSILWAISCNCLIF